MTWTDTLSAKKEPVASPIAARPATAKPPRKATGSAEDRRRDAYLCATLAGEIEAVRTAPNGTRNNALNTAALKLGSLVASGALNSSDVISALTEAAQAAGLGLDEIGKTIASGMGAGAESPRDVPEPKERANAANDQIPPADDYVHTDADADAPAYETSGMGGKPPPPLEEPTADDPLRGLDALRAVAVHGRAALLARAAEPVEYVWQDIAVCGTVVTCAGPSGCGKTTFAFMLVAARATLGEPVVLLGRLVTPAPIGQYLVLIEGEHSEGSAARVLVRAMALLGIDDVALDRIILVARKAVKLRSPEWTDVQRMIAAGLVSDVLVDTVARIAPADANSEIEQVAIFDEVAKAIEMAPDGGLPKPMFWLIQHTRKNQTTGGISDVSGSVQRVAQSDSVLMFSCEKVDGAVTETTIVFEKLREPPEDHPKPVSFSIVKEAEGTRRLITNLDPGKASTDSRPAEVRIVEFLESKPEPQTKEEIRKELKLSGTKIEDAISNLFESRSIRKRSVKRKTGDYAGFYVVSQSSAPEEF